MGSKNQTLDDVKKMLSHTDFIFGFVKSDTQELIGFARVLSDKVYFALIFDIIVAVDYRNKGLGTLILETIKHHPELSGIECLELCCRPEMIPFYEKCGFNKAAVRMNIIQPKGALIKQKLTPKRAILKPS